MDPARIQRNLSQRLSALTFGPPVAQVYNPLVYAKRSAELYLKRYLKPGAEALWLGMNPGPWGMAQTGVPFGEVGMARDWLGLEAPVDKPEHEHPKRPIQGYDCPRSEVSGRRLWGWARDRFETPERFFDRFFVWNYCPLVFMEEGGKNRTPDKLAAEEREALFAECDRALQQLVDVVQPRCILGVGRFAQDRAARALAGYGLPVHTILHPSPASPIANRGWAAQAEKQLTALGIELPGVSSK
ncbi:MAG: single-stranded DNA-binding protein [Planctomycetes bacterium]|nr:single-stranded DNA-binding protein [Planctomycetota bacterium]MCB9909215.1 single-stranded DNA-binding protein [Planctomycetota bacterium]MCB9913303.1 single-stranded DNA-binding protein [Planctomycetota bacterium]HPF15596.1 single-stranded DNA-binding protein [Planctomycetota bacterium]HRV82022.1 single-stranded DNA-binding protein [Planctomycetota bacterium]